MNSVGYGTFLNISQNVDNIKKIQLVSHYYNAALADTLNIIHLSKIQSCIFGRNLHLPPSSRK